MRTCDSQIHLFPSGHEERAAKFGQRVIPLETILADMDAAGIDRAILVPPFPAAMQISLDAVARYPDRFRTTAHLALNKPEAREEVTAWPDKAVTAVRVAFPPWHQVSWLDDGTADWFWPVAQRQELPVMVWAPGQLAKLGPIAAAHPQLRLIVDHLGFFVDDKDDALDPILDELVKLAVHPNIAVKASALPCATDEAYPYPGLRPRVERVVTAFGADRVFWGTDATRLPCSYREAVTMFTEELPFLTGSDLDLVMGGALLRWLRWDD
jgi:L-fuconolactonase